MAQKQKQNLQAAPGALGGARAAAQGASAAKPTGAFDIPDEAALAAKSGTDDAGSDLVPEFLKGISPALAARQILWAAAILLSVAGICLAVLGTIAAWVAVGQMYEAAVLPLDGMASSVRGISQALSPAMAGLSHADLAAANISSSLKSYSSAAGSISSTLGGLSSLPLIGSSLGFSKSIGELNDASVALDAAASEIEIMGNSAKEGAAGIGNTQAELQGVAQSLANAKESLSSAFSFMQIGALVFGMALCSLFCSTLFLALGMGIPKK